jgi:type IV pilus assembly protein PilB
MDSIQTISKIPGAQESLFFGELLVAKGLLSRDELIDVLNKQREHGGRLGEVLLRLKMLSDEDVTAALSEHFRMEYIHFDDTGKKDIIDINVARLLPESIAQRFCLVALREVDKKIVVAMADPLNVIALDTVTLKLKRQIKPAISSPREIQRAIEIIYHGSDVEEEQLRSLVEIEIGSDDTQENDAYLEDIVDTDSSGEAAANKAPVIRFVDLLMSQAVKSRASDIHIEP